MASLRELFDNIKDQFVTKKEVLSELHQQPTGKENSLLDKIAKLDEKLSQALALQWGYKEFYTFVRKALEGRKIGPDQFKVTPQIAELVGKLTALHVEHFNKGTAVGSLVDSDLFNNDIEFHFVKGSQSKL